MDYETWKQNYDAEFEKHRKENYRLIYSYQSDYEKYLNDPEWVQVGDFCNFHRVGTLHIGPGITRKYEKLMLEYIDVFKGFCLAEFERIRVYHEAFKDEVHFIEKAKKIFEYSNMSVRYGDLSEEQWECFIYALHSHLQSHREDIEDIYDLKRREKLLGL